MTKEEQFKLKSILVEFVKLYEDTNTELLDFNDVYEDACEVLDLEPKEIG